LRYQRRPSLGDLAFQRRALGQLRHGLLGALRVLQNGVVLDAMIGTASLKGDDPSSRLRDHGRRGAIRSRPAGSKGTT
jgi:hypothetical protein